MLRIELFTLQDVVMDNLLYEFVLMLISSPLGCVHIHIIYVCEHFLSKLNPSRN